MSNLRYEKFNNSSYQRYREYVLSHISAIRSAYIKFSIPIYKFVKQAHNRLNKNAEVVSVEDMNKLRDSIKVHDESKFDPEEFYAYAAKFFPSEKDTDKGQIELNFNNAWIHHYRNNMHHPEFYAIKSPKTGKLRYSRMSNNYFVEMILDWIAVSMVMHSSVYDWWYNGDGRKEKVQMLTEHDIYIIDHLMDEYKKEWDFSTDIDSSNL